MNEIIASISSKMIQQQQHCTHPKKTWAVQGCVRGSVAEGLLAWNKQLFSNTSVPQLNRFAYLIHVQICNGSRTFSITWLTKTVEQGLYHAGEEVLAEWGSAQAERPAVATTAAAPPSPWSAAASPPLTVTTLRLKSKVQGDLSRILSLSIKGEGN